MVRMLGLCLADFHAIGLDEAQSPLAEESGITQAYSPTTKSGRCEWAKSLRCIPNLCQSISLTAHTRVLRKHVSFNRMSFCSMLPRVTSYCSLTNHFVGVGLNEFTGTTLG